MIDKKEKLIQLVEEARDGNPIDDSYQFLIIPITTVRGYLEWYKELTKEIRDTVVPPQLIYHYLGIGFRITDEVHEHFHLNYMIDLNTHCPKTLYLSATLDPSGKFEDKMYRTMFPKYDRLGSDLYDAYIDVRAYKYRHDNPDRWRCMMRGMYSHVTYESNLLIGNGGANAREIYFKMVYDLIREYYLNIRQPSQKAIVFFSQIKTCTYFTQYLKRKEPSLDVRKYTGENDYQDLMEAEVAISTIGSAGTAVDIPGLILNINTISIDSKQANMQIMGRLRRLRKWPNQTPMYIYFVAQDLEKPLKYHFNKREMFKDKALTHKDIYSPYVLSKRSF